MYFFQPSCASGAENVRRRPPPRSPTNVRHYVLAGNRASGLDANSQFEALAQSTCKKKSGDSMSCISCHNPHYYPSADERASYYRGKCLACYGAAFGTKHQPKKSDYTACHMPSSLSTDIAHTEVTDHRIQRRPELSSQLRISGEVINCDFLNRETQEWLQSSMDLVRNAGESAARP